MINYIKIQGIFVFVFYVVLNEQVKSYWLGRLGIQEAQISTATSSSAANKSASTAMSATCSTSQGNVHLPDISPADIAPTEGNSGNKYEFSVN